MNQRQIEPSGLKQHRTQDCSSAVRGRCVVNDLDQHANQVNVCPRSRNPKQYYSAVLLASIHDETSVGHINLLIATRYFYCARVPQSCSHVFGCFSVANEMMPHPNNYVQIHERLYTFRSRCDFILNQLGFSLEIPPQDQSTLLGRIFGSKLISAVTTAEKTPSRGP